MGKEEEENSLGHPGHPFSVFPPPSYPIMGGCSFPYSLKLKYMICLSKTTLSEPLYQISWNSLAVSSSFWYFSEESKVPRWAAVSPSKKKICHERIHYFQFFYIHVLAFELRRVATKNLFFFFLRNQMRSETASESQGKTDQLMNIKQRISRIQNILLTKCNSISSIIVSVRGKSQEARKQTNKKD